MDPAAVATASTATKITVGAPTVEDVPALIALVNALAAERSFFFIMPIDPITGPAILRDHLASIAVSHNEAVLVARHEGELVGLVTGMRGTHPARRGGVEIGVGVYAPWRRQGIGAALVTGLAHWAQTVGCHRLQLHVVTANAPAIALYRKLGFVLEGNLCATATIDGKRFDELLMAKLID
jgi:RimJ/RimL family protein N-acetyltransferase